MWVFLDSSVSPCNDEEGVVSDELRLEVPDFGDELVPTNEEEESDSEADDECVPAELLKDICK